MQGRRHDHRRGRSSTEYTKRSLTNDNVGSGIKYRRDGSGRSDTISTTTTAETPLTEPINGTDGSTKYHSDGIQHSDLDYCYIDSSYDDGDSNTDSGSDDETINKYC